MDWINTRGRIYWYDQYALNEQKLAFSKYDPDRIVDELLDTGAEIIAVYATNQFSVAYYPSEILPMHPNLHGKDYFGEISSRLKAKGKKVIAYINWLESRHPEWMLVPLSHIDNKEQFIKDNTWPLADWADPDDPEKRVENMPGGAWRVSCINSPRRQQVLDIAREILDIYNPDMFHLDMLSQTEVCVCDYCLPELSRICGTPDIDQQVIAQHWNEYIEWRNASTAALINDLNAISHEKGVLHASNAMAPEFLPALWGQDQAWMPNLDVFLSECFDAFLVPGLDLNSTSVGVKFQHATGLPSWVLRTAHPTQYSHAPLSEAQWQLYAAACKANGCKVFGPCGTTANADTTTRQITHDRIKSGLEFFMRDADLDEGAVSAAPIAVVFSWATRRYETESDRMKWMGEINGWSRLLIEQHFPFDVVIAENASVESMQKYDLLILPDIKCLSEEFCRNIEQFVISGGKIIATGGSSLCDIDGKMLEDFRLSDVFGLHYQSETGQEKFAVEGREQHDPVDAVFYNVESAARVFRTRMETDPAGSVAGTLDPTPVSLSDYPAMTVNSFGSGSVIYCAFGIGSYFDRYGDQSIGLTMLDILQELTPVRLIEVDAPATVEVTLWRQPAKGLLIVHLANRTVPWSLPTTQRQISEIVPVHDIRLKLKGSGSVSVRGTEIASTLRSAETVFITLARLDAYAAVVLEEPLTRNAGRG